MNSRLDINSASVRKSIEKHKFENEEGEEYSPSRFGGFTDYFRRKKIKLQNLDEELRSSAPNNPPIFRGVVAHVNGYTQPSLQDLHTLIVSHGGGFLQYLDGKTAATHIIASNLTPKKKVEFRRYRIVKPAWVVDSIKAGKLLPWDGYRVVDEGIGQNVLAFDSGRVVSQANSQKPGYQDQTRHSWYTQEVKNFAAELNGDTLTQSFPSAQPQFSSGNNSDHDNDMHSGREISSEIFDHSPYRGDSLSSAISEIGNTGGDAGVRPQKNTSDKAEISPMLNLNTSPVIDDQPDGFLEQDAVSLQNLDSSREESSQEGTPGVSSAKFPIVQHIDGDGPRQIANSSDMTAEDHNAALLADPKIWKSTVVNPGFLKQYYEESRLHHLSTWKADLKSQLQALAAEKSSSQKIREKRIPGSRRYVLHVDFDSFFAAVSLKKFPQYVDLPVAIAHGGGSGSEIASCNYPARKFGVKNGMWMKSAQKLCPNLKVLPYDFKAYEEASRDFYAAILDTNGVVQSVSIDEALVDVSTICLATGESNGRGTQEESIEREQAKAEEIAFGLREDIKQKTGCAVSVGIGGNVLLAKVALKKAKPAGQYHVKPEDALEFLGGLRVQDLPGVAYSIGGKLEEIGVKFVRVVRELSKEKLMSTLGPKTGEKIWNYSRGIDNAEVGDQVIRKSVSAEVNWGIRFVTQEQVDEFLQSLCEELHKRLVNENVKGQQLHLKVMRRAADAPLDPPKHLGHGKCDTFNKSIVLGVATNNKDVLGREAISIMRGWGFSPGELRGIGVQMTKLESVKGTLESISLGSQKRLQFKTSDLHKVPTKKHQPPDEVDSPQRARGPLPNLASELAADISPSGKRRPPLNTLGTQFFLPTQADPEVLAELPEDIRSKIVPKNPIRTLFPPSRDTQASKSRSKSPSLPPDALPSRSQIDQETLDALPEDVRAEILAFYDSNSPQKPSTIPETSPLKLQPPKHGPTKQFKPTTPTKKRTGLASSRTQKVPFKGAAAGGSTNSTLTQSSFINFRTEPDPTTSNNENNQFTPENISPEFLSALPEDIRREVLEQARRDRLKKRGGIDILHPTKKKLNPAAAPSAPALTAGQRFLSLPPRPAKPTFTSKKVCTLPALRETISAWFEEFQEEGGPYVEDVDALIGYLKRVVDQEGDMDKAVRCVSWLGYVVDQGEASYTGKELGQGQEGWKAALDRVREGVQEGIRGRGIAPVVF